MSDFLIQQPLILASSSLSRQKLVESLGLQVTIIPSDVDEEQIKKQFTSRIFSDLAQTLAAAKADVVSKNYPEHFVIAADQLCIIDDQCLDKPGSHAIATEHLRLLRGKTHQQIAATCIAKGGEIVWENQKIANLSMKNLTDSTIESYLRLDKPYQSCGAYNYEGRAKWLFKEVKGSDCTILGLPLTPLMEALFNLGAVSF